MMNSKLSPSAVEALARDVVSLEDCFKVFELDDGPFLDKNSVGGKHLLDVVLTRCQEDPLALLAVWLDAMNLPLYPYVCDAVFKDLLTRYNTLEGLYMLYRVIPFEFEEEPDIEENWHRPIVEKMIKVCGKDLKKLSTMLRMFDKIPELTEMIQEAMSKAAE